MQNYRRLFFLVCIITVSISASLGANGISPFAGMSKSLEISIIELGHERPQVQQRVAAEIKDMNVSDDQIRLAWAKLARLFNYSGLLLEREHCMHHWLRATDQVAGLVDLDPAWADLLDIHTRGNPGDSALALDTFIIQLGEENPQAKQMAAAAIKDMNISDDQLLLAYAKVMRLLAAGIVYKEPWDLFENIDDAVLRLIDLDEALRGVLPLLKSANKDEAILARFVINQIGKALEFRHWGATPRPKDEAIIGTVPLLAESLTDPYVEIRETACRLLGVIPAHAEAAVPALIFALNDEIEDVRFAAVAILGDIAAAIPAVHPEILETLIALTDDSRYVQFAAVDALGDIDLALALNPPRRRAHRRAVPEVQLEIAERLIQLLSAPNFVIPARDFRSNRSFLFYRRPPPSYINFHVRIAAKLKSIGAPAVPLLVKAMDAPDAGVRHHAAIALAWIGSEHDEATLPILAEALDSPYLYTRDEAVSALKKLAEQAPLADEINSILKD